MKSIKPGRGPSFMGGIMGIFTAIFGVIWTIVVLQTGVWFMALFGIIFIVIAVTQIVYNFKNATSENRYSLYDITEDHEEPDPFNKAFKDKDAFNNNINEKSVSNYCPYCGNAISEDFEFCNKCGKKLP